MSDLVVRRVESKKDLKKFVKVPFHVHRDHPEWVPQLIMERMDYLNRDSFFTGVAEGVIGYDRILKMLTVQNGQLLVEEKAIYSIEKFLVSRRLMYWQVYLHKTVVAAEQTLVKLLQRAKQLVRSGFPMNISAPLLYFFAHDVTGDDFLYFVSCKKYNNPDYENQDIGIDIYHCNSYLMCRSSQGSGICRNSASY